MTPLDDGFSGTNYNRPAFGEMLSDIKLGNVNCVIVKDLSRLGREYIQSGQLLENFFPQYDTRFIAIDDSIDLDPNNCNQTTNMMIPFFNLMNEFYPADISKKTRSALQTKGGKGEYLAAFAPFGYKKSSTNKNKLVVDECCAKWVEFIFFKAAEGWSLSKIAKELHYLKVPTATDMRNHEQSYNWGSSVIKIILDNETYLGKTIYGKTKRLSYKNKKIIKLPTDKWSITENTHKALINEDLFREAKLKRKTRTRTTGNGSLQVFSGKLKCPDCHNMLNYCSEPRKGNPDEGYFVCRSNKRFGNQECSRHYIRYSVLEKTVHDEINILLSLALADRTALYKFILTEHEILEQSYKGTMQSNISAIDIRHKELEQIFVKLYQDRALNIINQNDYDTVYVCINDEKDKLYAEKSKIDQFLSSLSIQTKAIDAFIDILLKTKINDKLNSKAINDLVDFIEVENITKEFGQKIQYIRICYKKIGLLKKTEVKNS